MVKKTKAKVPKHKNSSKHVVIRPHHARPYRKRHIGLIIVSLTVVITLAIVALQYRDQVIAGVTSSRNFISDMFAPKTYSETSIESTNGFSLNVDQRKLYAVAVDGYSGILYEGNSLEQKRAYTKIQIATSSSMRFKESQSALTLTYHTDSKQSLTGDDMIGLALGSAGIDRKNIELLKTQQAAFGGKVFEQSVWATKEGKGPVKNLRASFSVFTSEINGYPLTIVISEGVVSEPGTHSQFEKILESLRFGTPVANISKQTAKKVSSRASSTIFDTLMMANVAAATSGHTTNDAEKTAALYGPAVAKIYNLYCMDIIVGGRPFLNEYCNGGTGSGFFVSQDGYFATNGHVAAIKPKDVAIYFSYIALAMTGSSDYISYLFTMAGGKESDYASISDPEELSDKLVDKLYEIDDSKFEKRNDIQNTFVVLGKKQPESTKLVQETKDRQKATLDATWKSARLVASDYRLIDGIKSFHASDVAILKVEGTNFPVTRLGSIGDVTQGANLAILGFPGTASENGLVDSTTTTATLTTGKVSSTKNAQGSDKQLIETDTTIGKGNSGGPAFSDEGKVIGIATYSSDGGGKGGGTFNYVRDIKDLQDLATKSSITFDTKSETQSEWETGMGYFYESRYSKALKNFAKVKELYPNHSKVAEFIKTAEKRIANGEDVVDFPVIPVVITGVVATGGLGAGAFLVIRHRKRHVVYKAGVAQGSVAPGTVQTVAVSPASPVVTPVVPPAPPQSSQAAPVVHPESTPSSQMNNSVVIQASETRYQNSTSPSITEQPASVDQPQQANVEQPVEPLFVQPVMAATPREPSAFTVPTRMDSTVQTTRPDTGSGMGVQRRY